MDIIDAYAHCGIRKYKPYEDLDAAMRAGGISKCVICQHRGEFDHSYIESVVLREPQRFRGVFLVDLTKPDGIDDVTHWATRKPKAFYGLRIQAETLATHRKLWLWAAELGLNFVVDGDLEVGAPLLDQFAKEMPKSNIQITHLAQLKDVSRLASRPNVHVQISGMHQYDKLPYPKLRDTVDRLWKDFGDTRLLYASNFPVMAEHSVYLQEIEWVKSRKSAQRIMHDNAARIWFR